MTRATQKTLTYTSHEGNSWGLVLNQTNTRILVDPWLVGSLTFGGLDFIYEGKNRVFGKDEPVHLDAVAKDTDMILLTMSIDDHCHKPTLEAICARRKDVPIVGSPSAAALARSIGFTNVTELDHGQEVDMGTVKIRATAGALVGPPWSKREAGFVIREKDGISLYYEPHCDFEPSSVKQAGTCDVVVSPPNTQSLLGYDLVKGTTENVALLSMLRPKAVIALMNAEFDGSGPLAALISETGGPELLRQQIQDAPGIDSDTRVVVPKSGEPTTVAV